ncbi:abortive infection system toxin AbiGii family protein [Anaerofustis stercorihominis]|uniref:abortive infection system toxin AbiGii family protein n=1 Tax=Anaerofustis stercorihominis TaxID=214853 RepID=UPI0011062269|nr:abortive infection system toxin AbiGii family protein [Anaerofustis stercorihominis]
MANFFENFGDERNCKEILPEVLEMISAKYNGAFFYERDEKSKAYFLNLNKDKNINFEIKNLEIIGLDEIKKNCGKEDLTFEELLNYSTNAMEYIEIKLNKDFPITINGVNLDERDLILSENTVSKRNTKLYIKSGDESKEIPLKITETEGGNVYVFTAYQKPCKSLYKRKYSTKDDKWLIIDIDIDRKKGKIHFKYTLNNKIIKTAEDYLSALKFVKNADKNTIDFLDFKYNLSGDKNILPDDSLIEIWENIVALEKELGFKFELGEDKTLSDKEIIQIKKLYRTLVEKKPFKWDEKLNNLSFDILDESKKIIKDFRDKKGKFALFGDGKDDDVEIAFSKSVELYQISAFFNLKYDYDETDKKNKKYVIYFKNDNNDERYKSVMFFKTEEEMNKFKSDNNFLNILAKAEELKGIQKRES